MYSCEQRHIDATAKNVQREQFACQLSKVNADQYQIDVFTIESVQQDDRGFYQFFAGACKESIIVEKSDIGDHKYGKKFVCSNGRIKQNAIF